MNLYAHMRIAEDMGVSKGFVIQAHKRWLTSQMELTDNEIRDFSDWIDGVLDINEHFALLQLTRLCLKKNKQLREYRSTINYLKPDTGQITDDMIKRAQSVPVDELVEFTRGQAVAFCHNDSKPSLMFNRQTGKARCFVCHESFNAIDICMKRDNLTFIQAVKQLSR